MCGTCGCGSEENGVKIQTPKELLNSKEAISENIEKSDSHDHSHAHDHVHPHTHAHPHTHSHSHGHGHGNSMDSHRHTVIDLEQDILQHNNLMASRNRGYFEAKNIFALNLVSSPGSGKTSILERTLKELKEELQFYVIEGDQQTLNDANRIDALNVPVVQINTGKGCHLESDMVYRAVKKLEIEENSILMIENVGNLVCPSMFDLGEKNRIVIISTTEGEDKPLKYPDMFHTSNVCIINKIDLLPYLNFDMDKLKSYAKQVNPEIEFLEVSATSGEGMEQWYEWLKKNKNK